MIGDLFAPMAMKVAAGIIGAQFLALALFWWGWNRTEAEADKAKAAATVCEERHSTTKASVARLEQVMAELIHDGEVRVERVSDAMAQARQEAGQAKREAEAVRRAPVRSDCVTPSEIMKARGL